MQSAFHLKAIAAIGKVAERDIILFRNLPFALQSYEPIAIFNAPEQGIVAHIEMYGKCVFVTLQTYLLLSNEIQRTVFHESCVMRNIHSSHKHLRGLPSYQYIPWIKAGEAFRTAEIEHARSTDSHAPRIVVSHGYIVAVVIVDEIILAPFHATDTLIRAHPKVSLPIFCNSPNMKIVQTACRGIGRKSENITFTKGNKPLTRSTPDASASVSNNGIHCVRREPLKFCQLFDELHLAIINQQSTAKSAYPHTPQTILDYRTN